MKTEQAKCHCSNISAEIVFSKPITSFEPRACDCDFCTKHAAAYISDPEGKLVIRICNPDQTTFYKQGSGIADFLVCSMCGVLICVIYSHQGISMGSVNSRTLEDRSTLKPPVAASPKLLSAPEKMDRWKNLWFQSVIIS